MVGETLGHYEILEPLGSGGMGDVYRARDSRLDRLVALKTLSEHLNEDAEAEMRFEREAKAVAAIAHPNILEIHDFGRADDVIYVVTELLEGETLQGLLQRAPLSRRAMLDIAQQVCRGLAAAHDAHVVHRDLKPANIFITKDDRVKILDFGLAKTVHRERPEGHSPDLGASSIDRLQTLPGVVLGTVGYMSPEQVRGRQTDHRSDIFSLGAILYEMATGQRAFTGASAIETMNAILTAAPPELSRSLPAFSLGLQRVIDRCLAKSREKRFQSARDVEFALGSMEDSSSGREELTLRMADPQAGKSIAVLPFRNLSLDPNEYFSDGVTEEIINALGQIRDLSVAARTSSFSFKGRTPAVEEVGAKLHVANVLEGSVRRSGEQLRITARLIDAANGYQLWSESYDRQMDDIFAVQDEIAKTIAEKMEVTLSEGSDPRLVRPPTDNLEAYDLYLKGRFFWEQRGDGLRKGLESFRKALELDPDYAQAHSGLADAYSLLGFYGMLPPHEVMPRAKAAAKRALELDETSAEAHNALAFINMTYDWDWAGGTAELERAIALNPRYATARQWHALFTLMCYRQHQEEALAESLQAIELDPLATQPFHILGILLWVQRRYADLVARLQPIAERDSASFLAWWVLGLGHFGEAAYGEAASAFERAIDLSGRHSWPLSHLAMTLVASGRRTEAEALQLELVDRAEQAYMSGAILAIFPLACGRINEAFEFFEKAYEERDGLLPLLTCWPAFDPARDDPRFDILLKRIGLGRDS